MISFEINNAFLTGSICEMVWKKSQGKKVQKKHKVSQHSQLFNCKEHGTRNLSSFMDAAGIEKRGIHP